MQRNIALPVTILAFIVFLGWCIRNHSVDIQQDVGGTVASALAANQISTKGLTVDGRDVVLTGPLGSRETSVETRKMVAGLEGVRTVEVRTIAAVSEAMPDAKAVAVRTQTQSKVDQLLTGRVVEFNPSSARLTAKGRAVLDQVAPLLAASPALLCEIQGHTDSAGDAEANKDLSFRRAVETKNYLVGKGIAAERLSPKAFGDSQPIATNQTAAGRRKNRRINFLLKEKP